MNDKEYQYLKIPYDVVENKDICPTSKLLYGKLLLLSHKHGYIHASNDYLVVLMNKKSRTITRLLSDLERYNFISIIGGRNFHRKIYLNVKNN